MAELDHVHDDLRVLVGQVLSDRYRVDALLGTGGMGAVFRGHHLGLKRDVAIKVLHPDLGRDKQTSKRFDREAQSASRLDHPNCVRVTDFGSTSTGMKYLVMQFLEGEELRILLGQVVPPARAAGIMLQVFRALDHAHRQGIVHRDIKPENIFLTRDYKGEEVVKLVDFGIAKIIDETPANETLTRAGLVFGTPRYMSPEQAMGGKIDERTDLYAAGLLLYELLAGLPPFRSDDAGALLRMHIAMPPPALPDTIPQPLAEVVMKLLEKDRENRFATAEQVCEALEAVLPELEHVPSALAGARPAAAAPAAGKQEHRDDPPPPAAAALAHAPTLHDARPAPATTDRATATDGPAATAGPDPSAAADLAATPRPSPAGTTRAPSGAPPTRKPLLAWLAAVLGVTALAGGAWALSRDDEGDTPLPPPPQEQEAPAAAADPGGDPRPERHDPEAGTAFDALPPPPDAPDDQRAKSKRRRDGNAEPAGGGSARKRRPPSSEAGSQPDREPPNPLEGVDVNQVKDELEGRFGKDQVDQARDMVQGALDQMEEDEAADRHPGRGRGRGNRKKREREKSKTKKHKEKKDKDKKDKGKTD